jgi:hypothetical protein
MTRETLSGLESGLNPVYTSEASPEVSGFSTPPVRGWKPDTGGLSGSGYPVSGKRIGSDCDHEASTFHAPDHPAPARLPSTEAVP